jgi:hypothetical protein
MWLPRDDLLARYEGRVVGIRQKTGCWGELKWGKVSPAYLDAYRELLDEALNLPGLKFSALVVDTRRFTRAAMEKFHADGKRDTAYLKFVRMLLRNHLAKYAAAGHREFTVLYDKRSLARPLLRDFRSVLETDLMKISTNVKADCSFVHLGPVNSASRPLLQATDLLAGAICATWNGAREDSKKGEARRVLRRDMVEWAGCDLHATSNPRPRFDLWEWQPRKN